MDFELKGFYLKLDYLQSLISSLDRLDSAIAYGTDGYLVNMNRGRGRRALPIQDGRP